MKKKLSLLILAALIFSLAGCGKVKLESGDVVSDTSVLYTGAFVCDVIDTSFIPDNFSVNGLNTTESEYSYILGCYNSSTGSDDQYFVKFDKSGSVLASGILDMPIYTSDYTVFYSDRFGDVFPAGSNTYNDCFVSYSGFCFEPSGAFSGYCEVYGYTYHEEDESESSFIEDYFIKWDKDGKCISVENCVGIDYSFYEFTGLESDNSGNVYKSFSSGISLFDKKNNYIDVYFDFLNSDLYSDGFSSFSVIDENSFSGVYTDLNGNTILGCFNKTGNGSGNKQALIIACSGITKEIKEDVYRYNCDNNEYRFAVVDYSARNFDGNLSEGWTDLKNDLINGYNPDIILNSSGYDPAFISRMIQDGRFCNLSDAIKKDKDLKGFEISEKAASLFYAYKDIYSIVPSYSYRTVVGSSDEYGADDNWDEYKFISKFEPVVDDRVIFYGETRDSFICKILEFNGYTYIDSAAKTAEFDNEGFIDYLKLASQLPEDFDEASEKQYSEANYGQTYLLDSLVYSLGDMHLQFSNYSKGAYYDLGIPSGVNNGSGVYCASMSFMISARNAYTQECWDFIKKYLAEDYQEKIEFSIPVSSAAYDIWLNDTTPKSNNQLLFYYTKDGMEYYIWPPEESEADYLRSNLNSCRRLEFKDYAVEQIVLQYADQFFEGKITAEEAAAAIDKDVEAYLAS